MYFVSFRRTPDSSSWQVQKTRINKQLQIFWLWPSVITGVTTIYEFIKIDGVVERTTDGARRKCPWGAKQKVPFF